MSSPLNQSPALARVLLRGVSAAWVLCASACGTRPLLPTLSVHARLTLRKGASELATKVSHDFGLQAQLSFRPRGRPHPRVPQGTTPLTLSLLLPVAADCQQALLCEWAELAEESTLSALGVSP